MLVPQVKEMTNPSHVELATFLFLILAIGSGGGTPCVFNQVIIVPPPSWRVDQKRKWTDGYISLLASARTSRLSRKLENPRTFGLVFRSTRGTSGMLDLTFP